MENEERSLFFDKEEYEDEDGHFPISDYFDSQEAIAYGNYGPQGRKINLHISHPKHLNLVILKSDAATVSIPELQLEESPGTGRFATVSDLLVEMNSKLQQSAGYFSGPFAVKFSALFTKMQDMLAARKPFTLVIDDPLSNSFLKKSKYLKETDYDVINYNRTWDINEEYGLLETPRDYYDNHLETSESARKLAELIKNSRKIAAFTGAGISVESGVPAFRMTDQTNDIWSKYSPSDAEYGSFINSEESRGRYWELKTHFYELLKDSKPNPAHKFFGYLNEQDKLLSVVTQNIDGLHETGGVPAEKMVHIHGTELEVTCMDCGKVYSRAEVHEKILSGERVPRCECGGILKSGTILFGQPLDIDVVNKAKSIMEECDLLIIVGSSLVVQPANKLPGICLTRKVPVVLITQTETKYDNFVDLVISEPCGQFLGEVLQQLQSDT